MHLEGQATSEIITSKFTMNHNYMEKLSGM